MTKKDIAAKISNRSHKSEFVTPQSAEAVINAFTSLVKETVASGGTITIRGFGSFIPIQKAEKVARNISTNEPLIVPAHMAPKFNPSKEFMQQVREGVEIEK